MEKIWLSSYPEGVPPEVVTDTFASVAEVFEDAVAKYGDKPAFINMGKTLSFNEIDARSRAVALW